MEMLIYKLDLKTCILYNVENGQLSQPNPNLNPNLNPNTTKSWVRHSNHQKATITPSTTTQPTTNSNYMKE